MTDIQTLLPIAGTVTTLGTAWLTIRKISKDASKAKREQAAEILHAAKEEDALLRSRLEAKIQALAVEVSNLEISVNKDMDHLKETYTSEIKNLGEKIESLRDELRNQHTGILSLLSKLVDKN